MYTATDSALVSLLHYHFTNKCFGSTECYFPQKCLVCVFLVTVIANMVNKTFKFNASKSSIDLISPYFSCFLIRFRSLGVLVLDCCVTVWHIIHLSTFTSFGSILGCVSEIPAVLEY